MTCALALAFSGEVLARRRDDPHVAMFCIPADLGHIIVNCTWVKQGTHQGDATSIRLEDVLDDVVNAKATKRPSSQTDASAIKRNPQLSRWHADKSGCEQHTEILEPKLVTKSLVTLPNRGDIW